MTEGDERSFLLEVSVILLLKQSGCRAGYSRETELPLTAVGCLLYPPLRSSAQPSSSDVQLENFDFTTSITATDWPGIDRPEKIQSFPSSSNKIKQNRNLIYFPV